MSEYGKVDAQQVPPEILQQLARQANVDPSTVRTIVLEPEMAEPGGPWISIQEAASKYSLHPAILLKLAKDGVIRASRAVRKPGDSLLLQGDVEQVARRIALGVRANSEDTITATEAADLCDVSVSTILNWVKKGHIRRADGNPDDRRKVLLKRKDVDLAAVLVQLSGVAKGRYVFPAGFTPA